MATLDVTVTADGPWNLSIADTDTGPSKGHMVDAATPSHRLASPMFVSAGDGLGSPLDAPVGILATGPGSAVVHVKLGQAVGPSDLPGTYSIVLVFRAVSTF